MAWNNTVPATGHSASQDYTPMRENFQQMQASFSINHQPLGIGGATEGYHSQIQLAAPLSGNPGLASPVASLYTKTVSGASQLFFQNGAAASAAIQLTNAMSLLASGYITLPGGLIIQWGSAGINNGFSASGTPPGTPTSFPIPFPAAVFAMVVSPNTTTSADALGVGFSLTGLSQYLITRNGTSGTVTQYWIAIGN